MDKTLLSLVNLLTIKSENCGKSNN